MLQERQESGMRERDTQISRDVSVDIDTEVDEPGESTVQDEGNSSLLSGLRQRAGQFVSTRSILLALVLMIVCLFIVGIIPFLGILGNVLAVFLAGFLYGLGTDSRRYAELTIAGALAGGGSILLGNVVIAIIGSGLSIVAFGAAGGAIAGAVGHYFGRDLRSGLTQDLSEEYS